MRGGYLRGWSSRRADDRLVSQPNGIDLKVLREIASFCRDHGMVHLLSTVGAHPQSDTICRLMPQQSRLEFLET